MKRSRFDSSQNEGESFTKKDLEVYPPRSLKVAVTQRKFSLTETIETLIIGERKMAKMTMHKELDMLRVEVEALRKQKEAREKEERVEAQKAEKVREMELLEAEEKAEEIMESLEEGKLDAKETLYHLMDTIQKDYDNLSPTSAIVLFALGAAFGNALSSK